MLLWPDPGSFFLFTSSFMSVFGACLVRSLVLQLVVHCWAYMLSSRIYEKRYDWGDGVLVVR